MTKAYIKTPMRELSYKSLQIIQIMAIFMMMSICLLAVPTVLADAPSAANGALNGIKSIVSLITNIVGIILIIVGFVRYVMTHANDDGPSQQKAALFIGTGIALLLVGSIISAMDLIGWIAPENLGAQKA